MEWLLVVVDVVVVVNIILEEATVTVVDRGID